MRTLFICFILFATLSSFAQNFELIGGINRNTFYDMQGDDSPLNTKYTPSRGYVARIGVENFKGDLSSLRFVLSYEKYAGKATVQYSSMSGGSTTEGDFSKQTLSLAMFPLNLQVFRHVDVNLGFEFSVLVHESFSGKQWGWQMDQTYNRKLQETYDEYSEKTGLGLRGRIAYDFRIADSFIISPQYSYYLGFFQEFEESQAKIKSMRHSVGIGIQWILR